MRKPLPPPQYPELSVHLRRGLPSEVCQAYWDVLDAEDRQRKASAVDIRMAGSLNGTYHAAAESLTTALDRLIESVEKANAKGANISLNDIGESFQDSCDLGLSARYNLSERAEKRRANHLALTSTV